MKHWTRANRSLSAAVVAMATALSMGGCGDDDLPLNCYDSTLIIRDDGIAENAYGWIGNAGYVRLAEPFAPMAYPATLQSVSIALTSNEVQRFDLTIAVYAANGPSGLPGKRLGSKKFVAYPSPSGDLPREVSFQDFDMSSLKLKIQSGEVYISAEWDRRRMDGSVYIAVDESPTTIHQNGVSASSNDNDRWEPIYGFSDDGSDEYKAMMLRPTFQECDP